jgi:hypothetical protein
MYAGTTRPATEIEQRDWHRTVTAACLTAREGRPCRHLRIEYKGRRLTAPQWCWVRRCPLAKTPPEKAGEEEAGQDA